MAARKRAETARKNDCIRIVENFIIMTVSDPTAVGLNIASIRQLYEPDLDVWHGVSLRGTTFQAKRSRQTRGSWRCSPSSSAQLSRGPGS